MDGLRRRVRSRNLQETVPARPRAGSVTSNDSPDVGVFDFSKSYPRAAAANALRSISLRSVASLGPHPRVSCLSPGTGFRTPNFSHKSRRSVQAARCRAASQTTLRCQKPMRLVINKKPMAIQPLERATRRHRIILDVLAPACTPYPSITKAGADPADIGSVDDLAGADQPVFLPSMVEQSRSLSNEIKRTREPRTGLAAGPLRVSRHWPQGRRTRRGHGLRPVIPSIYGS